MTLLPIPAHCLNRELNWNWKELRQMEKQEKKLKMKDGLTATRVRQPIQEDGEQRWSPRLYQPGAGRRRPCREDGRGLLLREEGLSHGQRWQKRPTMRRRMGRPRLKRLKENENETKERTPVLLLLEVIQSFSNSQLISNTCFVVNEKKIKN